MGERVRASRVWLRYGSLVAAVVGALVLAPSLHAQTPDPGPTPSPTARPDQQPQARTPTSAQPPAAQEGFVPVEQLPNPQDTIPAPRLVATAYACVWIVLMAYLYSIRRRLGTVQRELDVVSRRLSTGNRSR
jgi:CcmD family protein